ncbi:hypothetical protein CTEN210_13343 [Chaetoceros tenuissimus]|uniref:HSF-type DNA-binding domain-containing protein n=1 Tax=Chaetoceros tenuissimus TaxID=426638 RepID=A0AAD3HAP1_9STRA|nr:hypothetical protein CTEN210_13343 [Chaetoceros tenuissimus]
MISSLNTHIELLSITKKLNFPAKLFFILEFIDLYAPHLKSIFSWKHHGRCFHISEKKAFEQNIMTLFFNSAKYDTFRRQLNIWGFTRIVKVKSPDIGCYFHEKFLRGQFELCNTIIRQRASEFMKMPGNQPDFEEMPIMPATVALSIPHFAGFAKNLSSALCGDKDVGSNFNCNSTAQVSCDKKRKQGMDDGSQTYEKKAGMYSSLVSPVYPSSGPPSINLNDFPRQLPSIIYSSNDIWSKFSVSQQFFSDQATLPSRKKAKRVSINSTQDNNDSFNEVATTLSSNPNPLIIPTIDAMPIDESLALLQVFFNQKQVDDFKSMNMIPCATSTTATACSPTMTYHHNSAKDTSEAQESKENLLASKDTSLLHASSSASTFKKSSDILFKELASCNSLLSISSATDLTEMKDFLLDESNQAWFEESLSF